MVSDYRTHNVLWGTVCLQRLYGNLVNYGIIKYVGASNEIAQLLDIQIASNTSPSMKKILPPKNLIFIAF